MRIPISISPFFFLTAALIGFLNSGSIVGIFVWIGIIFVSVLFHELGHALTAMIFRQNVSIQLIAFGGLTSYTGPLLKLWQKFIIVFNGPLFGFLLFLFASFLLQFQWPLLALSIVKITQVANLFWSIVNLFPVMPLDGGQLLQIALEGWFGVKGIKASYLVGAILSTLLALGFFAIGAFLVGAFFFLFAFNSFDYWRRAKSMTAEDRDESLARKLLEGEQAFMTGKYSSAEKLFTEIIEKTKLGDLRNGATQGLALVRWREGHKDEAYQLLLTVEPSLADDVRCVLHTLAAEHQNWDLVAKLSTTCFQFAPSKEMALNNARAFAFLHQPKPAGGWLQTAVSEGITDIENILKESEFQAIKEQPEFQHFIQNLE
jgi:stage IV sporulation protein FB